MEIARDEIFGPLVGLLRARDEAHALELANASANTGCPARCSAATWNARCALPASFARG